MPSRGRGLPQDVEYRTSVLDLRPRYQGVIWLAQPDLHPTLSSICDSLQNSEGRKGHLARPSARHQPLTRDGASVMDSSVRRRAPTPHGILYSRIILQAGAR
jgi:hypothetical protein